MLLETLLLLLSSVLSSILVPILVSSCLSPRTMTLMDKENIYIQEKKLLKGKIKIYSLFLLGLTLWFLGTFQQVQMEKIAEIMSPPLPGPFSQMRLFPLISTQLFISGLSYLILCLPYVLFSSYSRKAYLLFLGKSPPQKKAWFEYLHYIMLLLLGLPRFTIGLLMLMGFPPIQILGLLSGSDVLYSSFGNAPLYPLGLVIDLKQLGLSFVCSILFLSFLFYLLAYLPAKRRGYTLRDAFLYEGLILYKAKDSRENP